MLKYLFMSLLLAQSASLYAYSAADLKAKLLAMTDAQLFEESTQYVVKKGRLWTGVGACMSWNDSYACDWYVKYWKSGNFEGLPYNVPSSGCFGNGNGKTNIRAVKWSDWPSYAQTNDAKANSVAVIRDALKQSTDYCDLETYVKTIVPPITAGSRLSSLLVTFANDSSGKKPNLKDCGVLTQKNGIDVFNKLPESQCVTYARYQQQAAQSLVHDVSTANMDLMKKVANINPDDISLKVLTYVSSINKTIQGEVYKLQQQQIYVDKYIANNTFTASDFDSFPAYKDQKDIDKLVQARKAALDADMQILKPKLISKVEDKDIKPAILSLVNGQSYTPPSPTPLPTGLAYTNLLATEKIDFQNYQNQQH